jgi:hypothetical protein
MNNQESQGGTRQAPAISAFNLSHEIEDRRGIIVSNALADSIHKGLCFK